jgi:hypothetical protein
MHMLEEMQRKRSRAIEQQNVTLLQIVKIAVRKIATETLQIRPNAGRYQAVAAEHIADGRRNTLDVRGRVYQQRRECFESEVHHTTSIGVLALFGEPKRFV